MKKDNTKKMSENFIYNDVSKVIAFFVSGVCTHISIGFSDGEQMMLLGNIYSNPFIDKLQVNYKLLMMCQLLLIHPDNIRTSAKDTLSFN
jgi:hypothetical protein